MAFKSFILALFCLALLGCNRQSKPEELKPVKVADLEPGYALLYGLLSNEKHVAKIFLIKKETGEIDSLVKAIDRFSGDSAAKLKKTLPKDWKGDNNSLPSMEQATRKAIEKTTTKELLDAKGVPFEFRLLLTQAEGLNYGRHLSRVLADHETNTERQQIFREIAEGYDKFYFHVMDLISRTERRPLAAERGR